MNRVSRTTASGADNVRRFQDPTGQGQASQYRRWRTRTSRRPPDKPPTFSALCQSHRRRLIAPNVYRQLSSRRSRRGPLVDLDCAGLDTRDQLATELGRVGNRIEAAYQERRDAEAVVAEDRVCHLLGGTDEAGGVTERPGRLGDAHPEPLVVNVLLLREGELPPAGIVDGRADTLLPGPAELACHAGEDAVRLIPRRLLPSRQ